MTQTLLAPVHRLIGGTLILMVLIFSIWAAVGKLDIVVQAQGKLAPASAVKISQPAEAGAVVALLVKDGDTVQAGQLLARMDGLPSEKDAEALEAEYALAQARLVSIDAALQGKSAISGQAAIDAEFTLRLQAYDAAARTAEAALVKAKRDLASTQQSLLKAQRSLPMVEKVESTQRGLRDQGLTPDTAYTEKLRELVERQQDVKVLEANAQAGEAAVNQATLSAHQVSADFLRQLAQERSQVVAQLQKSKAELAKAQHRQRLTEVRAPVAGVVNSLAIRTEGQVVAAGSTLMTVVPTDEALVVEAWVRNEDAGFVFPGMPVKVKLATFPFQKYGWLNGEVAWVGADSETPESMRNAQGELLFYKVRVALKSQSLSRDGRSFDAKPGMQAVADVQLGERTLLEYLTSPLKKAVLEAARER